jgi:hypothetical protein
VCKIEQSLKSARDILVELGVEELRSWVNGELLPSFGTLTTDLFPCRIDVPSGRTPQGVRLFCVLVQGGDSNLLPVDVQLRTPDLPGLKAPPVVVFDVREDSSEGETIGRRKQEASDSLATSCLCARNR